MLTEVVTALVESQKDFVKELVKANREDGEARAQERAAEREAERSRKENDGERLRSTIKLTPNVRYPVLDDNDFDPEDFYENLNTHANWLTKDAV